MTCAPSLIVQHARRVLVAVTVTILATMAWAATGFDVFAQERLEACAADCFVLTRVSVEGVTAYPLAELAGTYDRLLAREIDVDDLVGVATAITDKYRGDGYFLTRAAVAPLEPGTGSATIVVYEGFISEVEVDGPARAALTPVLRPVAGRRPLRIAELDRRLALASDFPGVEIVNSIEPVLGDPAAHRLVVVSKLKRAEGALYLENRGSSSQGPWQGYSTGSVNSAIVPGDQLTLSVLTTPENVEELTYGEVAYSAVLAGGGRGRFAVSGYTTDAPPTSPNGWVGSQSAAVSASIAQPLVRSRQRSLWLNGALDVREVQQSFDGTGSNNERLSVARVWLSGQQRFDSGYLGGALQLSRGLDLFNATTEIAPGLTRSDADGQFTKLNINIYGYRDLGRVAGIYGQISGQWSDDALLGSEEFFVGGPSLGRAFSYGEAGGDDGVAGMIELRVGWRPKAPAVTFVQLFSFVDAARLSNRSSVGWRTNELSSVGFGVRASFKGEATLKIEVAKPMERPDYSRRDTGWRTFVSVSKTF